MKSPLAQLLLLSVFVGLGVWFSLRVFVGNTDDYVSSLDIRSVERLTYVAPTESNSKPAESKEPMTPGVFAEPEATMPTPEELGTDGEFAADESEEGEEDEEGAEEDVNNDEEEQEREGSSLSGEELAARDKARREKLAELGLLHEKPTELTIAADVSLVMPDECAGAAIAKVPAVLKFRFESSRIMGESLNVLESLLAVYRECEQGYFAIEANPLGFEDADEILVQMRLDEIKYFFLQHNISLDIVEFPTDR